MTKSRPHDTQDATSQENDLVDHVHAVIEGGRAARRTGAASPWPATDKLRTMLHCTGWVFEDLRLALVKRDPDYRQDRMTIDNLFG